MKICDGISIVCNRYAAQRRKIFFGETFLFRVKCHPIRPSKWPVTSARSVPFIARCDEWPNSRSKYHSTQKASVSGELLTITCDYAAPWRSFLHEVDFKSKLKYAQGLSCGEERVFYACCYNLDLVKRHDNYFNQHISFPLLNFHLKKTKVEISRRSGLHWLNELPGMR